VLTGTADARRQELFRAQMLTEMARMSLEDGLVMQIHPGSVRNHNRKVYEQYGRDTGADIPRPTNYVDALHPLLDRFGNEPNLTIILFTLDESTYSREFSAVGRPLSKPAPWAALVVPRQPEGMLRFREQATETAGFITPSDLTMTRGHFCPFLHVTMLPSMDCAFLAKLVTEHASQKRSLRSGKGLTYRLVKKAYHL